MPKVNETYKKKKRITITISEELEKEIIVKSIRENKKRSQIVAMILNDYFKPNEGQGE